MLCILLLVKLSLTALVISRHLFTQLDRIIATLSVKNPSVKSDEFLPWLRIFFTNEIFCQRNFLPTDFFYQQIIFTNELVFLFGKC